MRGEKREERPQALAGSLGCRRGEGSASAETRGEYSMTRGLRHAGGSGRPTA